MSAVAAIEAGGAQEPRVLRVWNLEHGHAGQMSPSTYQPTVLIIHHDDDEQQALGSMLDSCYRLVFADSTIEARQRLHLMQPDVILCNRSTQDIDGGWFCSWLKSHGSWRYVPVIAIASADDSASMAAALETDVDDVVARPTLKARELNARVIAALRIRERYLDLAFRSLDQMRTLVHTRNS